MGREQETTKNNEKASTTIKRIAIIGGGISGYALAQLLKLQQGFEVTIYERDRTSKAREQGYYMGLNENGFKALDPLIPILPHLEAILGPKNTMKKLRMLDRNGTELVELNTVTSLGRSCFVDRCAFHKCLGYDLNIEYDKRFVRYEELEDRVIAHFDDGTQIEADLLIGSDGARSQVRKQRCPSVTYNDLGITTTAGIVTKTDVNISERIKSMMSHSLVRFLGDGGHTFLIFEYNKVSDEVGGRLQGVNRDTESLWVMSWPGQNEDWQHLVATEDITDDYGRSKGNNKQNLRDVLIDKARMYFANVPDILAMVEASSDFWGPRQLHSSDPQVLLKNPLGDKPSRVVLIGDSIHPMTPNRGNGANTALFDASDLAKTLQKIEQGADWKTALVEFNKVVVSRGHVAVKESLRSTNSIHAMGWKASIRDWVMWGFGYGVYFYQKAKGTA